MVAEGSALVYIDGRGRWVAPGDDNFPSDDDVVPRVVDTVVPVNGSKTTLSVETSGNPTGGALVLSTMGPSGPFDATVDFDASGAELSDAIEAAMALAGYPAPEVQTAGGPLGTLPIALQIQQPGDFTASSVDTQQLTGGASPDATYEVTTPGVDANPGSTGTVWVDIVTAAGYLQTSDTATAPDWKKITP